MRSRVVAVSGWVLALLAATCGFHGISRSARIASLPEVACVESAIESVPDVTDVRHWQGAGSRPLTLTGLKPPDEVHYFAYRYEGTDARIILSANYKDEAAFHQDLGHIPYDPPQATIDRIRPVMIQVESAVAERCDVPELRSEIEEHCADVRCED